jgi:diamine N-acetyltransferase
LAKRQIGPLTSGRVRLRLLQEADLPMTLAWRNQDHIRTWFVHSDVITPDQHRRWYEGYRDRDDDFVFVIEEIETLHRPVGQVALYRIDRAAKRAEFGRLLVGDPEARGHGLAAAATRLLMAEAFGPMALNEVVLEVFETNSAALAVYQACGFVETGRVGGMIAMHMTAGDRLQ